MSLSRKTPLKRKTPMKRGGSLSRKTRLKGKSAKRIAEDLVLSAIYKAWIPKECARCGCPGEGWLKNGGSFDPHHIAGRSGWRLFVFVPVCRECHDWIHQNPSLAREDGWLVTFKPKR